MEQVEEASGRKQVRGRGGEPAAPCVTAAGGRGRSVTQSETADGLSGGKGESLRALACTGVPSNAQQTQADGVCEGD